MYSCLKLITEAIGANGFYNQLRLAVLFEVSSVILIINYIVLYVY